MLHRAAGQPPRRASLGDADGSTADVRADATSARATGVTIVVALPPGHDRADPATDPRDGGARSPTRSRSAPNTVLPGGLVASLAIGLVVRLAWRRGRDRRYAGSAVDAAFGNDDRRGGAGRVRPRRRGTGRVRAARTACCPARSARSSTSTRTSSTSPRRSSTSRCAAGSRSPISTKDYELTATPVVGQGHAAAVRDRADERAVRRRTDGEALRPQVQVPRAARGDPERDVRRRRHPGLVSHPPRPDPSALGPARDRACCSRSDRSRCSSRRRRRSGWCRSAWCSPRSRCSWSRAACRRAPARAARCSRGCAASAACSTKATRDCARSSPNSTTSSRSTCPTRSCSAAPTSGRVCSPNSTRSSCETSWYRGNAPFNAVAARELDQPLRHGRDRHVVREPAVVVERQRLRRRLLRRWRRRWRRRQLVTRLHR